MCVVLSFYIYHRTSRQRLGNEIVYGYKLLVGIVLVGVGTDCSFALTAPLVPCAPLGPKTRIAILGGALILAAAARSGWRHG